MQMKKKILSGVVLTLVLIMLFTMFAGIASAATMLKVTTTTYLSKSMSTSSKDRIIKVTKGSLVTQIATGKSYYKVNYGGKEGYIKKSYLISSYGFGTIGAIKIDNTKVDYNVTIGNDNKYYMNYTSKDKKSSGGAIFADFRNIDAKRRSNLILYGHNMKNGTMFATLHKYDDAAFFAANPAVKLSLNGGMGMPKGEYTFTIFAQGEFLLDSALNPWRTQFENAGDFRNHIQAIYDYCKAQGFNVASSAPTNAQQILTLSTCVLPRSTAKRYLVFAYVNQAL